jgi:hypothetical protein
VLLDGGYVEAVDGLVGVGIGGSNARLFEEYFVEEPVILERY